ncbi:MAG: alanine--tRNA ligase [Actinobacteria bacterium]|uniref:Alanine--tRNA ligase n=1 Tax=freshwater metagenome TaxID=449393 RepID=A0A6J6T439_9ZZZZ|nr:alanine--tRNA ligase [Actinomycetota bacterium]
MDSAEIRSRFLRYFADRGHQIVPSASLLLDDPTLLFVNAGMVPFKPYFLGEAPAPYPRATSVQKVVRTLDIEEVGKTTRHASFFQMAGNFSFGDYFKAEAIPFAWDLLTRSIADGGYGFPEDRLWATVYLDDDEAIDIWHKKVGLPLDRIQRRGMADNFWSMGVPGPCGPCSEIYYDRGSEYGLDGGPVVDEDRYLEVWNLVFMQSERGAGPAKEDYPILGDLPAQNIDTGMGLERMAALLQGVENIYEIDTTRGILDRACELSGAVYGRNAKDDVALRIVADHARTCAFLIGDGVIPGNEGRGYVLRRIMRRTIRMMRLLGAGDPAMPELIDVTVLTMAPQYPELNDEANRIRQIAAGEEAVFLQTLKTGTTIFDDAVQQVKNRGSNTLPGAKAFALHDTYGFPFDLTLEMAAEQGLVVDEEAFRQLMGQQRERAKADARDRKVGLTATTEYRDILQAGGTTEFTGYLEAASDAKVIGLLRDGVTVPAAGLGEHVEVILNRSPFYAEAGGQLGDHGRIVTADGGVVEIYDVQVPVPGLFVHRGEVVVGEIVQGAVVTGEVDVARRKAISRAHTATHLIHRAFRERLGDTATQMGSENAPGRIRFDFPNPTPVGALVLQEVEARVNEVLLDDLEVSAQLMTQPEARAMGAMALFGEKYGDQVRVVSVGDWAHELCGGTHAMRSGQLGVVTFLSEGSIGTGVRRLEALVGADAYTYLAREHVLVNRLTDLMKAPSEELVERIERTVTALKDAERDLTKVKSAQLVAGIDAIIGEGRLIGEVRVWAFEAPAGTSAGELRELAIKGRGRNRPEVPVVLIGSAITDNKVSMVSASNPRAIELGLTASWLLDIALAGVGGRGGGKDDLAQGGGPDVAGVAKALGLVEAAIAKRQGG